jgi:hypothetical protein
MDIDTSTEEVYYSRGYNRGVANQTQFIIQLIEESDLPNKAEILELIFKKNNS